MQLKTAALLLIMAVPVPAEAAESIVGRWAHQGACGDEGQVVTIGPKSVDGPFICAFHSVSRRADVVTWTGHCYGPDGDRRPLEGDDDGVMTARLVNDQLTLEGLGLGAGPLKRCPR